MRKLRSILILFTFLILAGCTVSIKKTTTTINTTTTIEQTTTTVMITTTTTTEQVTTTTNENASPFDNTYYKDAIGETGTTLKQSLHNIIDNHTKLSYDAVKYALRETDEDPDNADHLILFYTGRSQDKDSFIGSTNNQDDWNREHVWPQSLGKFGTGYGPGTDLHHLKPTDTSVNAKRGNLNFDYSGSVYNECVILVCMYDSDSWEPDDSIKGDVARMIFYMAVRYEGDDGYVNLEMNDLSTNGTQSGSVAYIGRISILLEWNILDPVDDFEMNRNNVIFEQYQFNRNPFIDHPEWADLIWNS